MKIVSWLFGTALMVLSFFPFLDKVATQGDIYWGVGMIIVWLSITKS